MSWTLVLTSTFKRGFKRKDALLKRKVESALAELASSEDPRALGIPKHGQLRGTYAFELDHSNRILYAVDPERKEIHFLRTCSHAEVYRS
ncbi:MAG: hypothetical protein LYZ66_06135 [Nitrososphaerales archaeon]|nr:hypothetical protein [Nitrososphaerales archaeon]